MLDSVVQCPDIVIPSDSNVSNVLEAREIYGDAYALTLFSPSTLDAHAFVIEVAYDPDALVWHTYKELNPATSVVVPAAGQAYTYYGLVNTPAFRIKDNTGNVAADRTIKVQKKVRS